MSLGAPGFVGKALLLAPLAFAVGLAAREWVAGRAAEDAEVARRVARARGEWTPPPLSQDDRRRLLAERASLLAEISVAETRLLRARDAARDARG